ncbi:DUF1566 domain-containing protein [Rhodoferax sp. 4810]|nr:DUF1566 domain-containing protein [Rhodoferax jenense]
MKIKHLYCHATMALSLFAAIAATPAYAALNDTGITTCSNEIENDLLCPVDGFPRQDADYGRDAEASAGTLIKIGGGDAGFDFTKLDANGNELPATATNHSCVRDNVTGLIWEMKTTTGDLHDANWTYTWFDSNLGGIASGINTCLIPGRCDTEKFVQDVNASGLCGFNDWRMPNIQELIGIVHYDRTGFAIDDNYFPNTSNVFWSHSPSVNESDSIWVVGFDIGNAYTLHWNTDLSANSLSVRLVRGDSSNDNLIDHGDGTVTQTNSGLMWAKCSEGQTSAICLGTATSMSWNTALAAAQRSTLGGHTDWRVPSIKELQSLVATHYSAPAIDAAYFPNTPGAFFWTSSPYTFYSNRAWLVQFETGYPTSLFRDSVNYVRLVRNSQSFEPTVSFPFSLTLNGGGSVNSSPSADNNECIGVVCSGTYSAGTLVSLTAQPNNGWQFLGWGGACTGTAPCILTINAATDVTANFSQLTNQYQLDSPVNGSYESGIGVVHGWVCNANQVTVKVDNEEAFQIAYGAERLDSQTVCNDTNNGFAAAINWSDYNTGGHALKLIADGVELTRAAVMVTRLGDENFLTGVIKTTTVVDFPAAGQNTLLTWSEPNQNFVVTNSAARAFSIERAANGNWESPTDGGIESGRALIRGWACDASSVSFTLDGTTLIAPYGSGRGDTQSICGDTNNGYALAINWNDYADGAHQMLLTIDGAVVAIRQFTIATPGGLGSITGVQHQHTVTDFPNFGDQLTLQWSEPHQNFRIINYQPSTRTNAERITEIYIATLGYAPDNDGLQYWENELRGGSWTPTTVAQAFFDNDTVRALYPAENGNDLLIDALYHNIFNRAADETGKTYWLDELNSGHFTRDQMIIALIDGGWANADAAIDMARFNNQVQVGLAFANAQAERGIAYNALTPERQTHLQTLGAQIIRDVTADAATVTTAIAQIPGLLDTL